MQRDSITFNNKNSFLDFNILMESYTISSPYKSKYTATIPFSSSSFDFTNILGEDNFYDDRDLKFVFSYVGTSKEEMRTKLSDITEWLLETRGKSELYIGNDTGMYYLAEVEEDIQFETFDRACTFTVFMKAKPFRYGHCLEGTYKEWDCFNFIEDVLQETVFNLYKETRDVIIHNVGRRVIPIIKVEGNAVEVNVNGFTTTLNAGTHKNYSIILNKGANNIKLKSTGTSKIEFEFRKEKL